MKALIALTVWLGCSQCWASAGQLVAGTSEDRLFQRITAETEPAAKLQAMLQFEKEFPESKVLPNVLLMVVEHYRNIDDRAKILEYGERVLKLDPANVTAMMIVARNYAIEGKNLDRAVLLARSAWDEIARMKAGPVPVQYTDANWKIYVDNLESAARNILDYTTAMKSRKNEPR